MYNRRDDSLMLHTDLYQINMGETYWNDGIQDQMTIFDVYFRKMPFDSGYAVFAGLQRVIDYVSNFKFTDTDIEYLREQGYKEDYLAYLKDLRFTGNIRSMQEGEICFNNEPLMRIEAPLIQAQLLETAILNIINFQTLIATKASRIKNVVGDDIVMEFGTRRAQEMDAAVWGARAAYVAGFDSTSNVRAGKLFGIPISGTHAHSMVQAYDDEYTAFKKYAECHKNCVFLVDTFHTLKSGVPNAIRVAKELGNKINFVGIRLDSGDLSYLSKEARKMLDAAGFTDAIIFASNDLDEATILNLKQQDCKVTAWGIGTKLITAYDQPALGAVYKLTAIQDSNGVYDDRIKISNNAEKITTPGKKNVYRIINNKTGKSEGDFITLEHEDPTSWNEVKMFHPIYTYKQKIIKDFTAKPLHVDIFTDGQLVYDVPTLEEVRTYHIDSLSVIWEETMRFLNPEEYPVDLSTACWNNKQHEIQEVSQKVEAMRVDPSN